MKISKNLLINIVFILLIMPKYIDTILGNYGVILDLLRIASLFIVAIIFISQKHKIDKSLLFLMIYAIYIVCCTFFKNGSIIYVLNTYGTGVLSFMFIKIVSESSEKNKHYLSFIRMLNVLLGVNLVIIIYNLIVKNSLYISFEYDARFFLGSDNRFILFILIQTILYNYLLDDTSSNKKIERSMYISCVVNMLTLLIVWSASALVIYTLIVYFQLFHHKLQKALNVKLILGIAILVEVLIVFFQFQNLFQHFIVDILHKSLDLSYRTYIWDKALNEITFNTNTFLFGHGFINLVNKFYIYVVNAYGQMMNLTPIHLHNVLINNLYMGGIIGTSIYFMFIKSIVNRIILIKKHNVKIYNMYSIIIVSIITLLIFDVFDLYAQYFIILSLLCYSNLGNRAGGTKNENIIFD